MISRAPALRRRPLTREGCLVLAAQVKARQPKMGEGSGRRPGSRAPFDSIKSIAYPSGQMDGPGRYYG